MRLKEKIESAIKLTKEIVEQHPEISNIWFDFIDIPLDEINEVKKNEDEIDTVYRGGKDRLRFHYRTSDSTTTIFAFSNPIKIIQPSYVIEQ